MNPHIAEFRVTMDQLNAYMKSCRLTNDLRWRLREYFHKTRVRHRPPPSLTQLPPRALWPTPMLRVRHVYVCVYVHVCVHVSYVCV
jgi:hypothetical protein